VWVLVVLASELHFLIFFTSVFHIFATTVAVLSGPFSFSPEHHFLNPNPQTLSPRGNPANATVLPLPVCELCVWVWRALAAAAAVRQIKWLGSELAQLHSAGRLMLP
jgi:hypothetical protein